MTLTGQVLQYLVCTLAFADVMTSFGQLTEAILPRVAALAADAQLSTNQRVGRVWRFGVDALLL